MVMIQEDKIILFRKKSRNQPQNILVHKKHSNWSSENLVQRENVRNGLVQILCLDTHCFGFQKSPPVEKVQRDTFTICGVRKREETFGSY